MEKAIIPDQAILGEYKVEGKLNSNSKNSIYKVTKETEETGNIYIMKALPYATDEEIENFQQEIKVIELLGSNPLFVKFEDQFEHIIDVEYTDDNRKIYKYKKNYIFVITKYYDHSDLTTLTDLYQKGAEEKLVVEFLYQALTALVILSNQGIVHHDIKPANFLIASLDPIKFVLIDFEFAKILKDGEKTTSGDGTDIFKAPEVIKNEEHDMSCDIWAVGVSAFRLATGVYPFLITVKDKCNKVRDKIEQNNAIVNINSRFKRKSVELKELLLKMLDKNHKTRITAEKAIQSPLFDIYRSIDEGNDLNDSTRLSFSN